MDKETEGYYIEIRDKLRKRSMELKIEFLDLYLEQLVLRVPNAEVWINMDTIYTDAVEKFWTGAMHQIYNDARYNCTQLEIVDMYCPKE